MSPVRKLTSSDLSISCQRLGEVLPITLKLVVGGATFFAVWKTRITLWENTCSLSVPDFSCSVMPSRSLRTDATGGCPLSFARLVRQIADTINKRTKKDLHIMISKIYWRSVAWPQSLLKQINSSDPRTLSLRNIHQHSFDLRGIHLQPMIKTQTGNLN